MKAKKIVEKPIKNTGSKAEKTLIKKLGNSLLTKTLEDKKDFIGFASTFFMTLDRMGPEIIIAGIATKIP